jgi:type VI secretion system secreted protein VgrG
MSGSQVIAAGAALSAFSGDSQHNRLMRLESPFRDKDRQASIPTKFAMRVSFHERPNWIE